MLDVVAGGTVVGGGGTTITTVWGGDVGVGAGTVTPSAVVVEVLRLAVEARPAVEVVVVRFVAAAAAVEAVERDEFVVDVELEPSSSVLVDVGSLAQRSSSAAGGVLAFPT